MVSWRVGGLVMAVGLALSACAGTESADSTTSSASEPEVEADFGDSSTTSTTEETTTTETTLSAEQVEFDEQIALAERLMEPVQGLRSAYAVCLEDPVACDPATFDPFIAGETMASLSDDFDEERTEGRRYVDVDDSTYFVRHRLDSEDPLAAAVWTCVTFGHDSVLVDDQGEVVAEEQGTIGYGLNVYQVVEQPDGRLAVEQVLPLGEDEEQPEGGTCEAYEDWPPAEP